MIPYLPNMSSVKKPLETEAVNRAQEIKGKLKSKKENIDSNLYHKKDHYSDITSEENNIFSINSLIYFLEDFLENRLSSKLNNKASKDISSFKPWTKTKHSNMNEKPYIVPKNAAIAYAHGAKAMQSAHAMPRHHLTGIEKNNETLTDIYHLLRDLRDLRHEGINKIKLDKDGTFIDSIYKAVQNAKLEVNQNNFQR